MKKISSLRKTLFRTILIPTLGLFIILFLTIIISIRIIQRQSTSQQRFIVNTIALQNIEYFNEVISVIEILRHALPNLPQDKGSRFLTRVRRDNPRFTTFYILDEDGHVISESTDNLSLQGLDLSGEVYFKELSKTTNIYISPPYLSLSSGKLSLIAGIVMLDSENRKSYIIGELSLELLQKGIQRIESGEEVSAFIVDQTGIVLAHPNQRWVEERRNIKIHPLVSPEEGKGNIFRIFYDPLTESWYVGSSLQLESGWIVVVTQPLIVAVRPFLIFFIASLLSLLLSIFIVMRLQIYSVKQINSPISVLVEKALNLARGEYRAIENGAMGRIEEIISLSDSFNRMAKSVVERTEALKNSNIALNSELLERTKAERETKQLRDLLKNIIDSMPSVIIGVDSEGRITNWNREAGKDTGISSDEAYGKRLEELCPELSGQFSGIRRAIRDQVILSEHRVPLVREHRTRYRDITIYPILISQEKGAVIRIDDVTDNVLLEELMIQSEKMLSVGGLAAGMAHEINNPLAGILQNTDVLIRRLTTELPANLKAAEELSINLESLNSYLERRAIPDIINNIRSSGLRAAKIVEDMLNFSRQNDVSYSSHRLEELVEKSLELASTDYNLKKRYDFRSVKIVKEYASNLPPIRCQKQKIQQVLLNLLINGAQAMSDKLYPEGEEPMFIIRLYQREMTLCLELEDNGPGIKKEIRKRIFEPFYTTKEVGKGTGLGLSICYFIITEHHNGQLLVDSTYGAGTRFTIILPLGD